MRRSSVSRNSCQGDRALVRINNLRGPAKLLVDPGVLVSKSAQEWHPGPLGDVRMAKRLTFAVRDY
jgi:hypothetical protein